VLSLPYVQGNSSLCCLFPDHGGYFGIVSKVYHLKWRAGNRVVATAELLLCAEHIGAPHAQGSLHRLEDKARQFI